MLEISSSGNILKFNFFFLLDSKLISFKNENIILIKGKEVVNDNLMHEENILKSHKKDVELCTAGSLEEQKWMMKNDGND